MGKANHTLADMPKSPLVRCGKQRCPGCRCWVLKSHEYRVATADGVYFHGECRDMNNLVSDIQKLDHKKKGLAKRIQERKRVDANTGFEVFPAQVKEGDNQALVDLLKLLTEFGGMFEDERVEELKAVEDLVEARILQLNEDGMQSLWMDYLTKYPSRQNRLWTRWHETKSDELYRQGKTECYGCQAGGQYHEQGDCAFCLRVMVGHPDSYPLGYGGCPYIWTVIPPVE